MHRKDHSALTLRAPFPGDADRLVTSDLFCASCRVAIVKHLDQLAEWLFPFQDAPSRTWEASSAGVHDVMAKFGRGTASHSWRPRGAALVSLQPRLERLRDLNDLHNTHDLLRQPRLDSLLSPRWKARQQRPPHHRPPPRPQHAGLIELEEDALLVLRLRDEYQSRILRSLLLSAVQEVRLVPRPCVAAGTSKTL